MTAPPAAVEPRSGRSVGRWLGQVCGGVSPYVLVVLFGLAMADQIDQSTFVVLVPNIRDSFHLSDAGILTVVALSGASSLLLTVPIAHASDRTNRVRLALLGAAVWGRVTLGTGLAPVLWVLIVVRCGTASGQGVVFPTHNSLLSDTYPIESRPRIFSVHRSAATLGVVVGVTLGALITHLTGSWRWAFVVIAVPTFVLAIAGLRMPEPVRGRWEREALGADAELAGTEELPPSFAEAYRMVWKIASLRRIFFALPFLAASLVGFASLASLHYQQTFDLDVVPRALVQLPVQVAEVLGLVYGARLSTRLFVKDPALVFKLLTWAATVASVLAALFALAPDLPVAIVANAGIAACLAVVGPGILAALSLAIPARARAVGFSIGALFILPGLLVVPLVGALGDAWGLRWGLLVLTPVFLVGGLVIGSVGDVVAGDIADAWAGTNARAEMLLARRQGRQKLLLVRSLDVYYGDVQVLFGVDLEVDEGEIIALLGTNGAGKSTLLKAITGVAEAEKGAVVLDGRDITHMPPEEVAALGVAPVPGGQGVFPSLTVAENLLVAGWLTRRERALRRARAERVYETFPVLRDRQGEPAANLSGGQQQMLALSMAFLNRPRLLLIDELSLGLAPVVVEQLLELVRDLRDQGTTVILVEQSVNLALTVAQTAYFMEKGEIRFHGPTADLLTRPDVLRSVFLHGAEQGLGGPPAATAPAAAARAPEPTAPAQPSGPALVVDGLSVRFGGLRAVADVSFSLRSGEVVGIIGPNGAGKTTLFDLISGFTSADAGRVELFGDDVTALSAAARARRGLGRSFQDARLYPSLTVTEALAVAHERWLDVRDPLNAVFRLPAHQDSEAALAAQVDELIELLGIGAFRDKFVRELSTGSRRVVDLACILAHRPKVVLFDEPSSGIAQREAEALAPLLRRIRDHLDASIVIIEHDMALVTSLADRLLALDRGSVIAEGPPEDVLADAGVVAAYLGTSEAVIGRSGATPPHRSPGAGAGTVASTDPSAGGPAAPDAEPNVDPIGRHP